MKNFKSGQRSSTSRKPEPFVVWTNIVLPLDTTISTLTPLSGTVGVLRQCQHINSFREFVPKSYDSYKKPSSAGHKTSSKSNKRRAELPEPEILADRIPDVNPQAKETGVAPLRLSKVDRSSEWQVRLVNNDYIYKRDLKFKLTVLLLLCRNARP